jgi:hypothetical protein
MPVAYSGKRIIFDAIRGTSPADMIEDLAIRLPLVGWQVVRDVTGGGKVYEITSLQPALYKARVLIQDDLSYKIDNPTSDLYNFRSVVWQFMNQAEDALGFPHQVKTNNTFPTFQGLFGRCQGFLSVPGEANGAWSSVGGGIPYVPIVGGVCSEGLTPPTIGNIWWSCGGSQFPFSFREQSDCYACMSYCLNDAVVVAADNNNIRPLDGLLRVLPLTATNTISHNQIPWPTRIYNTNNPLVIDAFVSWEWKIRGQLWDAFLLTAAGTLDSLTSYTDEYAGNFFNVRATTWHAQFYSSLMLIYEVTGLGSGNVAY